MNIIIKLIIIYFIGIYFSYKIIKKNKHAPDSNIIKNLIFYKNKNYYQLIPYRI